MVAPDQVRRLARALPDVVELDHHGRPSFRVGGRIFATQWDPDHVNVMLDEAGIRTAVEASPIACREFWWGKRLRAVQVDLTAVDERLIGDLLADAWEQKAPRPSPWRARSAWETTIWPPGGTADCRPRRSTTG